MSVPGPEIIKKYSCSIQLINIKKYQVIQFFHAQISLECFFPVNKC